MTQEELKSLLDISENLENLAHHVEELLRSIKIANAAVQTEIKIPTKIE